MNAWNLRRKAAGGNRQLASTYSTASGVTCEFGVNDGTYPFEWCAACPTDR
jgi:hypothetical protein